MYGLHVYRSLSIAANDITALKNNTFGGILDKVDHLDISSLQLNLLEVCGRLDKRFKQLFQPFSIICFVSLRFHPLQNGALGKSTSLRSLRVSTYSSLPDFNIPQIVQHLLNLQKLWINSPEPQKVKTAAPNTKATFKSVSATDLRKEMTGKLPLKLREITIGGKGFTSISEDILKVHTAVYCYYYPLL